MKIITLTLFSFLSLTFLTDAQDKPCCKVEKHEEKSTAATAESIYQFDAEWTNQHDKKTTLAAFKGRQVLITMGYATCKFACPRLATDLTSIEKQLTEAERESTSIVFISIDPARDTPTLLKAFLDEYKVDQKRWHALTGKEDSVLELSVALGINYRKTNETDFAHSNIITLLSPTGEIVHRQEGLGADSTELLAALRKQLSMKAENAE